MGPFVFYVAVRACRLLVVVKILMESSIRRSALFLPAVFGRGDAEVFADVAAEERKVGEVQLVANLLDALRRVFQAVGDFCRNGFVNPLGCRSAARLFDDCRQIFRCFAKPVRIPRDGALFRRGRSQQIEKLSGKILFRVHAVGGIDRTDQGIESVGDTIYQSLYQTAHHIHIIVVVLLHDAAFEIIPIGLHILDELFRKRDAASLTQKKRLPPYFGGIRENLFVQTFRHTDDPSLEIGAHPGMIHDRLRGTEQ